MGVICLGQFPSMLEAVPEPSQPEMAVAARYLSLRDISRLGGSAHRWHTNHTSIIADLEPDLLYLSRHRTARASVLQIVQETGVQVNTLRDQRRHLLGDPAWRPDATFSLHTKAPN
jgi:hypothetical protein